MRRNSILPWTPMILSLALLCAAAPIQAQELPLAKIYIEGSEVFWDIHAEFKGYTLTVTGPLGFCFQKDYAPGDTPVFTIFDDNGERLPDDNYSWELRARTAAPPEGAKEIRTKFVTKGVVGTVQSGYLTIEDGKFRPMDIEEDGANSTAPILEAKNGPIATDPNAFTKDFVILDDLIVDGSACIGFDCVNGESFGFDTIRLKENNLRIKFQDTSTAASFPTNDWQLTANDSANGGASKFSIDDIDGGRTPFTVEARAPSHSLYVDDGGRLGLGTSTPVVDAHIVSGNTPTLRLEQNGSSGFAPQTWDVAGNETNFFIRDASNGSTLPFRIRPGASSNALFIDNNNDIGLGTASPDAPLHMLRTNGTAQVHIEDTTAGGTAALLRLEKAGPVSFRLDNSAGSSFSFQSSGINALLISKVGDSAPTITMRGENDPSGNASVSIEGSLEADNVAFPSSKHLKTDFAALDTVEVLDRLAEMPVMKWRFKTEDRSVRHFGPFAEDFREIFGLGSGKTLSIVDTNGVALAAIQGLNQKLEEKVSALESEKAEMRQELDELRELVSGLVEAQR